MRLSVRLTLMGAMLAVAATALVLGLCVAFLRWQLSAHIKVKVFNETTTAVRDLCIESTFTKRFAEELLPGGVADATIQSDGEGGIFFSYRDSNETVRESAPVYYAGTSGSLEIHITPEGVRLVNGIYFGLQEPRIRRSRRVKC